MSNPSSQTTTAPLIPYWRSILIVVLTLAAGGVALYGNRNLKASKEGVIMELPYQIDEFWGIEAEVSAGEKKILPEDTVFERKVYSSLEQENLLCSIVLSGAEKRSIHRPEVCLPAQGWTVADRRTVPIKLNNGFELKVTLLTIQQQVQLANGQPHTIASYYAYWFVGENVTTPDHFERVFMTSMDRVFKNINHRWAYVIVSMPITETTMGSGGRGREATLQLMKNFIAKAAPLFLKPEVFSKKG